MISFFNYCGKHAEQEPKALAFLEFEDEILELLKQEEPDNIDSPTQYQRLASSFSSSVMNVTPCKETIDKQDCYMFVIDEETEQEAVDWDKEIATFTSNMRQLSIRSEYDQENITLPEKKRSNKKKSLRNNKKKRSAPLYRKNQRILQERQLQVSASL
jgi:hypothetical protein